MTAQRNEHKKHKDTAADSEDKQKITSERNPGHSDEPNGLSDMGDNKAMDNLKDISKNRENREKQQGTANGTSNNDTKNAVINLVNDDSNFDDVTDGASQLSSLNRAVKKDSRP